MCLTVFGIHWVIERKGLYTQLGKAFDSSSDWKGELLISSSELCKHHTKYNILCLVFAFVVSVLASFIISGSMSGK